MPPDHRRRRIDRLYRLFYRGAYLAMRIFWFVFRPLTRGVNVALWHDGRLLVIEQSYRQGYTLPGGYLRFRESARAAAVREMMEELQLRIHPDELASWGQMQNRTEFRRDRVTLYEIQRTAMPGVHIDRREVVAARFLRPAAVIERPCSKSLAVYLASKGFFADGGPSKIDNIL